MSGTEIAFYLCMAVAALCIVSLTVGRLRQIRREIQRLDRLAAERAKDQDGGQQ